MKAKKRVKTLSKLRSVAEDHKNSVSSTLGKIEKSIATDFIRAPNRRGDGDGAAGTTILPLKKGVKRRYMIKGFMIIDYILSPVKGCGFFLHRADESNCGESWSTEESDAF